MDAPRSKEFDDVYFSVEDGLAETRHVFLQGNDLPAAWAGRERFVIGEAGFGTGLNFLAVYGLFRKTAKPHQILDFISVEKFPLKAEDIAGFLDRWRGDIGPELDELVRLYPPLLPGFHKVILNKQVALTLVFDDVSRAFGQLDGYVDAWFLDGFKPAGNPEMWAPAVLDHIARLSRAGTSLATFTAAGEVRRGLQQRGFAIKKVPGFGRKREMLTGCFKGADS